MPITWHTAAGTQEPLSARTLVSRHRGLSDGRTGVGGGQFGRGGFCGRGLARARTEQLHVVGWKPADLAFLSSSLGRGDQKVSRLLVCKCSYLLKISLSFLFGSTAAHRCHHG